MASRTAQDQLSAGDVIGDYVVMEVTDSFWGLGEVMVFLAPKEQEDEATFGREWELKRDDPTDEEGRPLLCPECYGPYVEGYPIEVLEG